MSTGDTDNPRPAPEEGTKAEVDWTGTVPPSGAAAGSQSPSESVPPLAGAETGAEAEPPPEMATGPQPPSGPEGLAVAGNACDAIGAAVGAEDAKMVEDAGGTA